MPLIFSPNFRPTTTPVLLLTKPLPNGCSLPAVIVFRSFFIVTWTRRELMDSKGPLSMLLNQSISSSNFGLMTMKAIEWDFDDQWNCINIDFKDNDIGDE
uniref:Neur_chan_LBD domain-containing protein n=1 Tax=Globodera pallida TaxID=36090 RepID=A0A183C6P5_GLOPA